MKKTFWKLTLFVCLFTACAGQKDDTKDPFPEYNIQGRLYEGTEIFANFPKIIWMDSLLIVHSAHPNSSGKFLTVFDLHENMNRMGDYISKGRGPKEFLQMNLNSSHGNRLFVRNMNMDEFAVLEVATDSIGVEIREIERIGYERIIYEDIAFEDKDISYLDDGHFVAVSCCQPGKFFSLYDNRMNWLVHFGDGPIGEVLDGMNARSRLGGRLAADNGEFVFASVPIPKVMFYKKTGDVPEKLWEDTFYDSYYKIENKHILFDPEKTVGLVRGIDLGKKYVYVLFIEATWGDYYGEKASFANVVFVFDRQGNRIARLNLDHKLHSISLDKDETTMYGIAETPEYMIVSFDLPAFEK